MGKISLFRPNNLKAWLAAMMGFALLQACAPTAVIPTPTQADVSALATPVPPAATATPIVEPMLPPAPRVELSDIQPPDFANKDSHLLDDGEFGLTAAHATYALYRQLVGPSMWPDDTQFIAEMSAYARQLKQQGIELKQATLPGKTYSLLTKGNQILLDFNQNGALRDVSPGRWSKDSTPEWIDAGGPVELYIGPDGNAYIAKVDENGKVIAFLNPHGATRDNLNNQWIPVQDGLPNAIWNGKEWSTEIPMLGVLNRPNNSEVLGISWKEIQSIPTKLTFADLNNPDLGPIMTAWDRRNGKPPALIVVGKLAAIGDPMQTIIYVNGDIPEKQTWIQLLIDIPFENGYFRLNEHIGPDRIINNNIEKLEVIYDMFNQLENNDIDPLDAGSYEQALSLLPKDTILAYRNKNPEILIDHILSLKNLEGQIIGSVISPEQHDSVTPNALYYYFLGQKPLPSNDQFNNFDTWRILLSKDMLPSE